MSNGRIRISFPEHYPYVNRNCSRVPHFRAGSSCPMPGMAVEIIALITDYLNLTVDVTKVGPMIPNWANAFDDVYNNETDLYAVPFAEDTAAYTIKYDFTKELHWENIKVLVRQTDHSFKSIFDFLTVYNWDVWISMIATFVLLTAFGLLVRYVECQLMLRERFNFVEVLWKMARFQLVQPERIDYNLIAGESSLLVFSLFQLCIILGLFQGYILTNIVKKVDPTPFTGSDFPQLVKEKKLTIVKPTKDIGNFWIFQEIETSYESPFYELREALKSNPYKTVENVMQTVDEGNEFVTFFEEYWWYRDLAESYCNLILVDGLFRSRPERFMFKKGSRFAPMFNKAIDVNNYLIKRIVRKYLLRDQQSSKCAPQRMGPTPLSMAPYYGLLIMLFVGMSSACFVLSGELLKWKMSRALTSGGGVATEGNSTMTAVDPPMDSKQSTLLVTRDSGNPPTLTALSAEVVAAVGLPPGAKLYVLMPQNNQP